MAENCNNDCSSCGEECSDRTEPQSFQADLNKFSTVKKVIGVVSGKGGVGKSLVTSLLASAMQKKGNSAAILDADITGPSIPKVFGIHERAMGIEEGIVPLQSKGGIKIMSMNLLVDDETRPVVWRGPIIGNVVKQFWTDVIWENVDYMFVDMPPGTGDVPLTVFQSLPVDGIVIVTSPQELVSMIVEKAVNMADMMNIPVYGVVENMAYFQCPSCGEKHKIFGESHVQELAEKFNILAISEIPIRKEISALSDEGKAEEIDTSYLEEIVSYIEKQ